MLTVGTRLQGVGNPLQMGCRGTLCRRYSLHQRDAGDATGAWQKWLSYLGRFTIVVECALLK